MVSPRRVQSGGAFWTAGEGGKKISGGWDIYSTVFSGDTYLHLV
ncbi:hypothetical protein ACIBJI_41205 [Nocardia sp. NPDC050408]